MALPASDSFTNSDGTTLTSHSASWTQKSGADFRINTNAAYSAASGGNHYAYWNADTFPNNQYSEITIGSLTGGYYIGAYCRMTADSSTKTAYRIQGDSGTWYLSKEVAGSTTDFDSTTTIPSAGDRVRISAIGTTIVATLNDTAWSGLTNQTDSAVTSGQAGIGAYNSSTSARIDSWKGGSAGVIHDATTTSSETATTPLVFSHTVTTENNRVLVVSVDVGHYASPNCTGVTYGGTSMTQIGSARDITGHECSMWYLLNPATGANNVSISFTGGTGSEYCAAVASSYWNVSQSGNPDASAGATGGVTAVTYNITTVANECVIIGAVANQALTLVNPTTTNAIERGYVDTTDINLSVQELHKSSPGTQAISWDNSDNWGIQLVSFKPYAGYTLEQEGFAFGSDDGSESAHTLNTQDANLTAPLGTKTLRTLINATDDPSSMAFKLKYQKNGTGGYSDVGVGATYLATPVVEAGDCTESGNNTATTSWSVTYPAYVSGDLLIFHVASDADVTHDWSATGPNGETVNTIKDSYGGTAQRVSGFWFVGSATTASGGFTVTPSSTEQWTAVVIKVPAGEFNATTPIQTNTGEANDTTTDTAFSTPTWTADATASGKIIVCAAHDTVTTNAAPAGWTTLIARDRGACGITVGTRNTANTASESIASADFTNVSAETDSSFGYIINAPTVNNQVYISTSSNVAAGGEDTTARLTAPSGKSTSDFVTGRRWDNENGSDSIDITIDDYTELEWVLTTQSSAAAGDYFEFRVYNGDTALNTYTVTPKWTIVTVSPDAISTTLALQAPTVSVSGGGDVSVSAGTNTTTLALQSPTITVVKNTTISPSQQSITLALQSPTVTAVKNSTVSADQQSCLLSVITPTVATQTNAVISASAQTATISLQAPTINTVKNITVSADQQSLTIAPQTGVITGNAITALSAQSTLITLNQPTVTTSANVALSTLSTITALQSPSIDAIKNNTTTVESLPLTLSIQSPTVTAGAIVSGNVIANTITLNAPSITGNSLTSPSQQSMIITPQSPTVTAVKNISVVVSSIDLTAAVEPVTITSVQDAVVSLNSLPLLTAIHNPTVTSIKNVTVSADQQSISITPQQPAITASAQITISEQSFSITALAPTVTGSSIYSANTIATTITPLVASVTTDIVNTAQVQQTTVSALEPNISITALLTPAQLSTSLSLETPTVITDGVVITDVTVYPQVLELGKGRVNKLISIDGSLGYKINNFYHIGI